MADISMCKGEVTFRNLKDKFICPLRENCYRYKAKPNEFRQTYLAEVPYDFVNKSCPLFWKMDGTV